MGQCHTFQGMCPCIEGHDICGGLRGSFEARQSQDDSLTPTRTFLHNTLAILYPRCIVPIVNRDACIPYQRPDSSISREHRFLRTPI